jgi:amino acid adenylation domain-containing protein
MIARGIEDLYPLSPTQQGLLFHSLRSESAVYIEQQVHVLRGDVDLAAWDRAWEAVLARHPALRTSFVWDDLDAPLQAVHNEVQLSLERLDWRAVPRGERESRLGDLVRAGAERPFDLRRAPLLRQTLIAMEDRVHVLVWAFHHLILDGWSRALVLRDWQTAYAACCQGRPAALPPAPPYRDFIAWLQRRDLAAAERFWRRELRGIEYPTPLPLPAGANTGWGVEEVRLSLDSTAALRELARRHRLTPNTVVQGAWALLLSRVSGEEDVVFGATVAGRPAELLGIEETAGLFLNTLPVRVRAADRERLVPWLQALQERQLEARAHEQTPLVAVQEWSEIARGLPLFETVLVFENYPIPAGPAGDGGSLEAEAHPDAGIGHTHYPLTLVAGTGPALGLRASYDQSRFAATAVLQLLERLRHVLEEMPAAPERPLGEIPLLSATERRQILEWGGKESEEPFVPVHRQVLEAARRAPGHTALVCGEVSLTWGELSLAVERLAGRLRAIGVGPEVVVAVVAERTLETPVALLAVLAAGGVYLPLDPMQPVERLTWLLEDAGAAVLVGREPALSSLASLAPRPLVRVALEAADEIAAVSSQAEPRPEDAAYLLYTSGTTGRPKGVVIEQRQLAHTLRSCRGFGWSTADRMPILAPLTFDISLFELLNPLLAGGTAVLLPREDVLDLERLAGALEEATVVHAVPVLLRELVDHLARADRRLPGVRLLFTGGDAVPAEVLSAARQVFPGAEMHVLYGPTEATIISTAYRVPPEPVPLPLGRPLPGVVLRVVDRRGELVPTGFPGEILLGGGGVARGYHEQPGLTAERFVESGGRRFYRTGDLARWTPEGELQFAGRADGQVKIRGVRVEPAEVEAALVRHPGVGEAAVVAREVPTGRDRRLVAYVTPAAGAKLAPEEVRRFAAGLLPEALVPGLVVVLPGLPRTAHGKLDRAALPEPVPDGGAGEPPRTAEEVRMAALWREILNVEVVGLDDDFFALGGHSLLATRVLSRVRSAFGVELSLRTLFDAPTLAGMAAAVAVARRPETAATARPAPPPILRRSREAHRVSRAALEQEG